MHNMRKRTATALFVITCIAASAATMSAAQNAPSGSCVVTGGWCWPLSPGPSGAPCQCNTPNGLVTGFIQ